MAFLNLIDFDVNPKYLPKGVIRQAFLWLFIVSGILIMCLFWFPLQEKISGHVEIYYKGAPMKIKSKVNGELNLYVKDQSHVKKGEILGWYNWNIKKDDYTALEALALFDYDGQSSKSIASLELLIDPIRSKAIPVVQGEISAISSALELYQNTLHQSSFDNYVDSQKKRIGTIENNKSLNRTVLNRKRRQAALLKEHIQSDSVLLAQGILSLREYEVRRQNYLNEIIKIEEESLALGSADESILGIESNIELGRYNLALVSIEQYKNLINALENYKKEYYKIGEEQKIISPISGKVTYADVLNFSQTISIGENILTIEPKLTETKTIARIITSPKSSGRVKIGNRVMIMLDAFPIEQYGIIYGLVNSKNELPEDNKYIFSLELVNGLTTSYGQKLSPQPQLTGKGTILINRTNIFEIIKNEVMAKKEYYFALEGDPEARTEAILK